MNRFFLFVVVVACVMMAGCAVKRYKTWAATGGSRSDATVQLSYEFYEMEIPVVDDNAGLNIAVERCKSWGYIGAEPFGGVVRTMNGPGSWLVTKTYQCIGQGSEVGHK